MLQWPPDEKPADIDLLTQGIVEAIKFAYKIERINEGRDIPFKGPEAPPLTLNPSGSECLRVSWLGTSPEDQIRTPLEIIVWIALRLGFEQQRRVAKETRRGKVDQVSDQLSFIEATVKAAKDDLDILKHLDRAFDSIKSQVEELAE